MATDDENSINQTIQIGIPLDGDARSIFSGTILSDSDLKKVSQSENSGALKFTSGNRSKPKPIDTSLPTEPKPIISTVSKSKKSRSVNAKLPDIEIYSRQISDIKTSLEEVKDFLEDQLEQYITSAVETALYKLDEKSKNKEQSILKSDSNVELKPKDALINIENIATYSFKYSGVTFYDDFIVLSLDESQFTVDLKSANLTLQLASHPDEQFNGVFLGKPFKPFPNVPYSILVFLKAPSIESLESNS